MISYVETWTEVIIQVSILNINTTEKSNDHINECDCLLVDKSKTFYMFKDKTGKTNDC